MIPGRGASRITGSMVFHVVSRDIGIGFQLAITAPRLDLNAYRIQAKQEFSPKGRG